METSKTLTDYINEFKRECHLSDSNAKRLDGLIEMAIVEGELRVLNRNVEIAKASWDAAKTGGS